MTTARTIGLGWGLVLLVGAGAVTLSRAQQAGEKIAPRAMTRGQLRERVIKLRVEADLLQVEFDIARSHLLDALKEPGEANPPDMAEMEEFLLEEADTFVVSFLFDKANRHEFGKWYKDRTKKDWTEVKPEEWLVEAKKWFKDKLKKETEKLTKSGPDKVSREDIEGMREIERLLSEDEKIKKGTAKAVIEEVRNTLRASVERRKTEFTTKSRILNEKKLDLAEAEKQYQNEAR